MSGSRKVTTGEVALVSMPWPLFSRPSIQLGALKAFLRQRVAGIRVEAHHFFLQAAASLGYDLYQPISERTWPAESVYAALLFPERIELIEALFRGETAAHPVLRKADFAGLVSRVGEVTDRFLDSMDWGRFALVGFSVCLCQLSASLYAIRRMKHSFPHVSVAVGGSGFAGEEACALFTAFPEIDYLVCGEGELPLEGLVRRLCGNGEEPDPRPIPGVLDRGTTDRGEGGGFSQLASLDLLPSPDYAEYFALLGNLGPQRAFFPTLPVEASRGCWWRRQGEGRGCAFCNLNLQWSGYRARSTSRVAAQVDELTARYKTLSVSFMDNVMPVRETREIFSAIGQLNKDLRIFCEIRATTPLKTLTVMRNSGVERVQIGIEALSSRLLGKMNKGTNALQNIEAMRNCEWLGIENSANLILHFPGSDEEDVAETLRALEFVTPFRPLSPVDFWLALEGPVYRRPGEFGVKAVFNHPNYGVLFPPGSTGDLRFMIQAYRGDISRQRRLWRPVRERLKQWAKTYAQLHGGQNGGPILSFRDGREFLIVRQRRTGGEPFNHRLVGTSREIYLFCLTSRPLKIIMTRFPALGESKVVSFLGMMMEKRLMYGENDTYLSLAVPQGVRKHPFPIDGE